MNKWTRFQYLPVLPLGEDGRIVTGSKEHINLSRRVAGEGMVLLKNENHTLPLRKGSKVALFGRASVDYVKGGGGSGDVTVAYVKNMCQAMQEKEEEGKVVVYKPLSDFYQEDVARQKEQEKLLPGRTTEPELPQELLEEAAKECDIAILSICRYSEEASDRKAEPNDGDYYLSLEEQKLVEQVLSRFEKTVVVFNVSGMVDTTWFCQEEKIPSVLLGWQGGMEGAPAQADILCGDVNPSGKLTDTLARSFDDYPSSCNIRESEDYVCYTDDVFVGYRYFETIPGAVEKVNYPFGFGLSYTEFSVQCGQVQETDGVLNLEVRVTNIGDVPGKEVVQVYNGSPVSWLDTPRLQLRAFKKTSLLLPGASETLHLSFAVSELASYDETTASYIIPAGAYEIFVGNSIRSLKKAYELNVSENKLICQLENRCVPKKLPCRMKADGSYEQLVMSEYEELHDTSDFPERIHWSAEHILPDNYGVKRPKDAPSLLKVVEGTMTLEDFLQSLSDDELITLLGGKPNRGMANVRGLGGLDHLGIPAVMTVDGPAGVRIKEVCGVKTTAWPAATLLACTWDVDLVYQVGVAGAREAKEMNFGMWLTPAVNIHRTPLCGRNFEYYSEDPLISGKIGAAMIRGIQSQNISACVKHFCANNTQMNVKYTDSRLSERALREIYLKPFKIVVEESDIWVVMTAYNQMNGRYTSENRELIMEILRGEWGYDGLVISDWDNMAEPYREILAGNNLRMPYGSLKRVQRALADGLITRENLLENARHILEFLMRLE